MLVQRHGLVVAAALLVTAHPVPAQQPASAARPSRVEVPVLPR
jgi:hypothetical protein